MKTRRIHFFGASGAGVTTLGGSLAAKLYISHHDIDRHDRQPAVKRAHACLVSSQCSTGTRDAAPN